MVENQPNVPGPLKNPETYNKRVLMCEKMVHIAYACEEEQCMNRTTIETLFSNLHLLHNLPITEIKFFGVYLCFHFRKDMTEETVWTQIELLFDKWMRAVLFAIQAELFGQHQPTIIKCTLGEWTRFQRK